MTYDAKTVKDVFQILVSQISKPNFDSLSSQKKEIFLEFATYILIRGKELSNSEIAQFLKIAETKFDISVMKLRLIKAKRLNSAPEEPKTISSLTPTQQLMYAILWFEENKQNCCEKFDMAFCSLLSNMTSEKTAGFLKRELLILKLNDENVFNLFLMAADMEGKIKALLYPHVEKIAKFDPTVEILEFQIRLLQYFNRPLKKEEDWAEMHLEFGEASDSDSD